MKKLVSIAVIALLFAGCSQERKQADSEASARVREETVKLLNKADEAFIGGNPEEALDILKQALADNQYVLDKNVVFNRLLEMLIETDQADEARALHLELAESDADLAKAGFGVLLSHYTSAGASDELIEWTGALLNLPLPDDLASVACSVHLNTLMKAGSLSNLVDLAPGFVERFDDRVGRNIFSALINHLVLSKQYEDATALLDAIEDASAKKPSLRSMILAERINLLFVQGRWLEAEKLFQQSLNQFADQELALSLRRVAPVAIKGGQFEMLDRLCGSILKNQVSKPLARRAAATQCLIIGKRTGGCPEVLRRMERLLGFDMPVEEVSRFFRAYFQDMLRGDNQDELKEMLRFGDKLLTLLQDDLEEFELQTTMLDLSFMIENYERSLQILDSEAFNRDDEWYGMAKNKIKAHMALRDGKNEEAIERFRAFMDYVATWELPEYDPTTGLLCSREMCLGLNAARIGNIFASMGKEADAAKAYEEARAYYAQALAETNSEKKEYDHIKAELAKLDATELGDAESKGPEPSQGPVPSESSEQTSDKGE